MATTILFFIFKFDSVSHISGTIQYLFFLCLACLVGIMSSRFMYILTYKNFIRFQRHSGVPVQVPVCLIQI